MIKNGWLLIIIAIMVFIKPLCAQDRVFLIPGVKFTKILGEKSENIFGIDLSIVIEDSENKPLWGINATYDFIAKQKKITFGAEYINSKYLYGGVSFGPAINLTDKSVGLYTTLFLTVFGVIPAFQYTYFFTSKNIGEFGLFGKLPLKIGGSKSGYFDTYINLGKININTE